MKPKLVKKSKEISEEKENQEPVKPIEVKPTDLKRKHIEIESSEE